MKWTLQIHSKSLCRICLWIGLIFNISIAAGQIYAADLPIIPGATGWGITTPAGRDGTIYKVTNLKASGPGSLRAALEASVPRVILFEVSGTIVLTEDLRISSPYVTIAGQTAPSPGVTLRGAGLVINTHDILVQHLRIRVGDDPNGPDPDNRDGISIDAHSQNIHNVVIDHCSVSWAIDGNIDLWNSPLHNVTIRYSLISEALNKSIHPKGAHSTGLLIGDGAKKISVIANLLAHNYDRNPRMNKNTTSEIVNNVIYNWSWYGLRTNAPANIIGNHYKPGPDTLPGAKGIYVQYGEKKSLVSKMVYVANNIGPGRPNATLDDWLAVSGKQIYQTHSAQNQNSGVVAIDANKAYNHVLKNVGARPADRDAVDKRVVKSVLNGTGGIINSQKEVAGWPNLAKNTRALVPPKNPNADNDNDGYSNLEEWLHSFAAQVEGNTSSQNSQPKRPDPPVMLKIE